MKLKDIAEYVTDKVSSEDIQLEAYVTTDSLLQNKAGRVFASNLPPEKCVLTKFQPGDVLIANIRPYLKKIWRADCDGGCNADVLAFRAKDNHCSKFLYAVLMQDTFFAYAMQGSKGSKMPRGDKSQMMRYEIPSLSSSEEESIGKFITDIDSKIALNREINRNLEAMARQLYDYWFVQFDFPDENGRPYKSSGGKMVWNERLKREIPEGWECKTIGEFAIVRRGSTITKAQTKQGDIKVVAAATNYSFLHNESNRSEFCITISSSGANAGFVNFWREPIYASDCSSVQGNSLVETLLCYYCLQHYQELLFNQQIGAAQPHVYPEHISKLYIVVPPIDVLRKIEILFIATNNKQGKVETEIESLTKQRDELLPLLMNGQVNCDLSVLL